jgi:hypothetical protein
VVKANRLWWARSTKLRQAVVPDVRGRRRRGNRWAHQSATPTAHEGATPSDERAMASVYPASGSPGSPTTRTHPSVLSLPGCAREAEGRGLGRGRGIGENGPTRLGPDAIVLSLFFYSFYFIFSFLLFSFGFEFPI